MPCPAPAVRREHRIGLPEAGRWVAVLATDATRFGGSGVSVGDLTAEPIGCRDLPYSAALTLPPLSVVWLTPDDDRNRR
ncbi:alpha amylase C-terminal domain-containing protein [Mycobacterium servetii]|uniref:alpha amylase C-terminal domain-containing protein n=1 Tax=Mycobacterium servetii TaxID=3237418 RepID=UPI003B5881AD